MNISGLAKEYYNTYSFTNSDTYAKYKVDDSKISEEAYSVSDLSSALEMMTGIGNTDFPYIGSVSNYANNLFLLSQSAIYNDFKDDYSSSSFVPQSGEISSIYDALADKNEIAVSAVKDKISAYEKSHVSSYSDFLEGNGLDIVV